MTSKVWNEDNLRADIVSVWGEYGSHIDVFDFMVKEIERLRDELDQAQLRSIEARNPGIDMEQVIEARRIGRGSSLGFAAEQADIINRTGA